MSKGKKDPLGNLKGIERLEAVLNQCAGPDFSFTSVELTGIRNLIESKRTTIPGIISFIEGKMIFEPVDTLNAIGEALKNITSVEEKQRAVVCAINSSIMAGETWDSINDLVMFVNRRSIRFR